MKVLKTTVSYPSALLIPSDLVPLLQRRLKNTNLRLYFKDLLSRQIPDFQSSKKWKKLYQHKGQNLQRFSFRPAEEDWQKLSLLSHGSGYSRCLLFVILLILDNPDDPIQKVSFIQATNVSLDDPCEYLERTIVILEMEDEFFNSPLNST